MKKLTAAVVLAVALGWNVSALAGPMLEVGGSPEYDAASDTGIQAGGIETYPGRGVNNNGMAVGKGFKYDSGDYLGERAVRWDWTGTAATELGTLGASNSGYNVSTAYAVNDAGTTAGHCLKFVAGFHKGNRAVRWDAGNTEATELDHLGLDANGSTDSMAFAINNAGTIVGLSEKWVSSTYKGSRAVRWDAGGTAAAELGHLGTDGDGITHAVAYAINDAGTIVGYSSKYVSGSYQGERAVRWDAGSTTATELDTISTDASGIGFAKAWVVNNAGTAVGYGTKYVSGVDKGERAVRWDAGGTTATELDALGTDSSGITHAQACAVNSSGTAVGWSEKYLSRDSKGERAVRWDAGSATATELSTLGLGNDGVTYSNAFAVNDAGTAVGWCWKYVEGVNQGHRAVVWLPDASVVDLNDLGVVNMPTGGEWTILKTANALSADGWVAGTGLFDPDGDGPLDPYNRMWVGQVGLGGSWINTADAHAVWGKGANWSTGTPAIQFDAEFDQNATYTVFFDADQRARAAHVTAGDVTFALGQHSLSLTDGLSVSDGARLASNGTIEAHVTNLGTLAPGNSTGMLTIDGNLASPGVLEFELNGVVSRQFDRLQVTGDVQLGTIQLKLGYHAALGDQFDLMDWGSLSDCVFAFDLSQAPLDPGLSWDTSNFIFDGSVRVIPEPATWSLMVLGLVTLAARRKRRGP